MIRTLDVVSILFAIATFVLLLSVIVEDLSEKQLLQSLGYLSRGLQEVTLRGTTAPLSLSYDATNLTGFLEEIWEACGEHAEQLLKGRRERNATAGGDEEC